MTANSELMSQAKESLSGNWGIAIGTFIVYAILTSVLQFIPFLGPIVGIVIGGPFALGIIIFAKNIANGEDAKLEQIFDGFKNFGTALATYLLTAVFVFLWMLLLIIPGIIMGLAYSQAMYIISDDPEIGAYEAISKSRKMMDGFKLKLFGMGLMFFGLSLLCVLTLGIGFFWLMPFASVTMVKFYQDVKADFEAKEGGPELAAEEVAS